MTLIKVMKYISRIDSGYTHCYFVRVGYDIKPKVVKCFSDMKCGSKRKALALAKEWRDKKVKQLGSKLFAANGYDANNQRHWGKGIHTALDLRYEPPRLSIRASYWDGKEMKQLAKSFSVNKFGYRKAMSLAKQWRKAKITGGCNVRQSPEV